MTDQENVNWRKSTHAKEAANTFDRVYYYYQQYTDIQITINHLNVLMVPT